MQLSLEMMSEDVKICLAVPENVYKAFSEKMGASITCGNLTSASARVSSIMTEEKKTKRKKCSNIDRYCLFQGFMRNLVRKSIVTTIRFMLDVQWQLYGRW